MKKPEELLFDSNKCRQILSDSCMRDHFNNYTEEERIQKRKELWEIRKPKIERVKCKIETALAKTQQVTPCFIDQLIGLYNRKNTSQKDRRYILLELKKYYNKKIIQFFFKLNDTELNRQLRHEAFDHLQGFSYQPRLRKQEFFQIHCKNKKRKEYLKKYAFETYEIPQNPNELEYRIENSKEQKIKEYDYFISHSSRDSATVQSVIIFENKLGKNVYCDWISDVDYLKRHLMCGATLKVIENRLNQSKAMIFVSSTNSYNSIWCKYELNYFKELGRPIFYISKDSVDNHNYELKEMEDTWFVEADYKNLALIEGKKINDHSNNLTN